MSGCKFEVGGLYEFIPDPCILMAPEMYHPGIVKVTEVTDRPVGRSHRIRCDIISGCKGLRNPHDFDEESNIGLCMHPFHETIYDDQLDVTFDAMMGGLNE